MRKLIVMGILSVSAAASAQNIDPKAIFGTIFEIIANELNKDKAPAKPNVPNNKNNKVILKESRREIVLGRVFFKDDVGMDSVQFPNCHPAPNNNKRVNRVRILANNGDVYLHSFRVTYMNGQTQTFRVGEELYSGETSRWYRVSSNNPCIQRVQVSAEVLVPWDNNNWNNGPGWNNGGGWNNNGPGWNNNGPGWGNNGPGWSNNGPGWGPGGGWNNGSGWNGPKPPPKPAPKPPRERAELYIVGEKAF